MLLLMQSLSLLVIVKSPLNLAIQTQLQVIQVKTQRENHSGVGAASAHEVNFNEALKKARYG